MSSNLADFRRQVLRNLKSVDGVTEIAFGDALNDAHKAIARSMDFDELMVLDSANAATVANQHRYHLIDDLGLTRPKDVYSIRYMANEESRKLSYIPPREMDQVLAYPDQLGTGKPSRYTQKGMYLELVRIPDANANLYVYHSQWPSTLSNDSDETDYLNIDDVIVQLTTEMTQAYVSGGSITDWTKRAATLLGQALGEHRYHPDHDYVARPFTPGRPRYVSEYWNDPWVKRSPR